MKKIFILLVSVCSLMIIGCSTIAQTQNDDVYYIPSDSEYINTSQTQNNDGVIYVNILDPTPTYIYRPYYQPNIIIDWNYVHYPFYYSYFWHRPYVWYNYHPYYWDYYRWDRHYWGYNHYNYHWYHNRYDRYYVWSGNNYNINSKYIGHRNSITGNNRINNDRNRYSNTISGRQNPQNYTPAGSNRLKNSKEFISPKYKNRGSDIIRSDRKKVNTIITPTDRQKVLPIETYKKETRKETPPVNPNIRKTQPQVNPNNRTSPQVRSSAPTRNVAPTRSSGRK